MSFEERLKDSVEDCGSKIDKSIKELLYSHYPEKEFAVCEMIVSTIWCISQPFYNSVVSTTPEYYKERPVYNFDSLFCIYKLIKTQCVDLKKVSSSSSLY